jgi:hypothetical protein
MTLFWYGFALGMCVAAAIIYGAYVGYGAFRRFVGRREKL